MAGTVGERVFDVEPRGVMGRRYSRPVTEPPTTSAEAGPVRYRCAACGNLTRFDVTTSRRTRAFHHYTVGGELTIEHTDVLEETVEDVSCRWCGNGRAVAVIGPDDVGGPAVERP
jgi:hypothetical protein